MQPVRIRPIEKYVSEYELSNNGAIAIDGPSSAGKTVVGTMLAKKMGYRFLDTGMMYRAATVAALDAGINFNNLHQLTVTAEQIDIEAHAGSEGETRILINGTDITSRLRGHEVDGKVSIVSAIPRIREIMVEAQRRLAAGGGIVMVGRDIGTVVLQDAAPKIYLTAALETRAERRFIEMKDRLGQPPLDQVLETMRVRDDIDSSREASPLRPADDAIIVETDDLSIEDVVCKLSDIARSIVR
jgi:cytidylate kinase